MSTQPRCEHWDYRLMNGSSVEGLSIREVMYDEEGGVVDWAPFPASLEAQSIEEFKIDIKDIEAALDKPTLHEAELEERLSDCPHCRQGRIDEE